MAQERVQDLADQLSALLREVDASIRTRVQASQKRERSHDLGLRSAMVAALRWLTRSAERRPMARRARSPHARSRTRDS